jgi:MoaA/NifB/PqqE/SkfB family radical SAM enzyme
MSSPLNMAISIGDWLLHHRMKHMIVHVTTACNFRCEHCFVDFESEKRDLKLPVFQKLGAQSPPLMWLDIGGGEPFLRKDLAEIVLSFDSQIVHIPTNGSLIPQMIEQIKKIKTRSDREIIIGLSLDGMEKQHNLIRKEESSWQQVWDAYQALRDLGGVSIKVCTVINNKNIQDIIPLMEEVQQRGVDFHSVILLRGETLDPSITLPPVSELKALAPKMFEILSRYDYGRSRLSAHLLQNFHRYLWNLSIETLEQQTQVIPCLSGQTQLVVWGDGQVGACEMLPPVGDLTRSDLPDILASDAWQEQLQFIKDKKCHCTHNCAMLDSIFYNPRSLPHLLHQEIKTS